MGRRERMGIGIRRSRYVSGDEMSWDGSGSGWWCWRDEMKVDLELISIGFVLGESCSWRRNERLRTPAAGQLRIQTPTLPRPTRPRPRPRHPRTPSSTTQTRPSTSPTPHTRSRSKISGYNLLRRSVPPKLDIPAQERARKMKTRWARSGRTGVLRSSSRARGGR